MKEVKKTKREKLVVRACHACLKVNESTTELQRCQHCNKAFLPLRYFEKIHQDKDLKFENHFSSSEELDESDLIKGLFVLW